MLSRSLFIIDLFSGEKLNNPIFLYQKWYTLQHIFQFLFSYIFNGYNNEKRDRYYDE